MIIVDEDEIRNGIQQRVRQCWLIHDLYDSLCIMEYDIINKKVIIDVFDKLIKNAKIIIEQLQGMPYCVLIKINQISTLLRKLNYPIFDVSIKDFFQIYNTYEKVISQLKRIQNTKKYKISKAYVFDDHLYLEYVALSPNGKYILVGTSKQVYVYDILTKLNIKIYKEQTIQGLFSQDSRQIILVTSKRIIIVDVKTSKKQQLRFKKDIQRSGCFIFQNYLYIIFTKRLTSKLFQIDIKSNHKIFSYDLSYSTDVKVQFFEDLISFEYDDYLQILNQETRELILSIKLQYYRIRQLFFISKNQMLLTDYDYILTIWNIDFQNNRLIRNKLLPYTANELYRGNPSFGYFYIITFDLIQIIDQNFNSIYRENEFNNCRLFRTSIQLNSDLLFIIFQSDGIFIFKRDDRS